MGTFHQLIDPLVSKLCRWSSA